jgi:hypothetical protein
MSRAGNIYALFYYNNGTVQQSLYRSDGEGKVWTRATCAGNPTPTAGANAELMAANGYLYASGGINLMRSSDGGESFVSIQPPEAQYCMGVCAKPGSPSVLCMLDYYNHIHVSSDSGSTWYPQKATPQTYITVPCNVQWLYWPYPGTLYALGTGGIAVSHDDGQSWTLLRYGDSNTRVLYFPPDPSLPPWGAYTSVLYRGQMVNGAWNGCFDGEIWVDPTAHTPPGGTRVNYFPSAFTTASVPWILFHPDRIIALGTSSLGVKTVSKSYVDVSANTIALNSHGWVTNQIVRYHKNSGDALQPLVDGQDYFVIFVDTSHIKLALTKDGPAIDLTTQGNDTQTLGLAQGGILTAPTSYIAAGTPVWTPAEIETGVDFGHGWIDPNNPSYVWASRVSAPYTYGGVWRSLDGGQTWAQADTGIELMAESGSAYGNPTLVSDGTPHDSVPVKPTAPVITAVTDLDPTVFSGLTVTYTPGQAALRHDLYMDGALVVSSYASGATYHPPDRQSHSYVVRAVNDAGYTDSNAMSGADLSVPALTSIDDLSPCAQTGIHVNYLGDPAALRHDLVRDGSVVVTGYVSGALYNPGDTASHTYIIRAVYSSSTADSNSVAFADANKTPGKPVITQIGDLDLSYLTGVEVNFTPGSGATSHDLYVDSTLVRRNISSGYVYKPGDEAQHSYVIRAYNGTCYADSDPVTGRDMGVTPPPIVDAASRVVLHYDLQARAWHEVQNSSPVRGYFWDHHRRVMRVWNGSTTGVAAQRGGPQFVEIDVAQLALGNSVALKRLRHVEVDLTYGEVTLTCEFYIDGQPVPVTVPQTVLPRGYKVMGETAGPDTAIFSEDGSGGAFDEPHRQVLRFPCPAGGRGKVLGAKITGTVQGFGRVDDVRLAFSEV